MANSPGKCYNCEAKGRNKPRKQQRALKSKSLPLNIPLCLLFKAYFSVQRNGPSILWIYKKTHDKYKLDEIKKIVMTSDDVSKHAYIAFRFHFSESNLFFCRSWKIEWHDVCAQVPYVLACSTSNVEAKSWRCVFDE